MKSTPLIKQLQEDSMGAADVASAATPLFASMVRRSKRPKLKVLTPVVAKKPRKLMGVKESFLTLKEASGLDSTSVIAKLKGLEKQETANNQPLAVFGLEDEEGNMVKVSVPADQGEDFEKSLQAALTMDDDTNAEIAEILFDLKDRFDILDVVWGDMVEDEEEMPEIDPNAPPVDGEIDPNAELPPEGNAAGTDDVSSLLVQVIDMMKSDAEARSAEAKARKAEADAKAEEAMSIQAAAKVRQEEQILDMESHDKKEKEVGKEAKRLAKLAKWRHDMTDSANEITDIEEVIPSYNAVTEPSAAPENEDEEMRAPQRSQLATLLLSKLGKK